MTCVRNGREQATAGRSIDQRATVCTCNLHIPLALLDVGHSYQGCGPSIGGRSIGDRSIDHSSTDAHLIDFCKLQIQNAVAFAYSRPFDENELHQPLSIDRLSRPRRPITCVRERKKASEQPWLITCEILITDYRSIDRSNGNR